MPVITLTDLAIRNLKAVPGKQVTYLDKSLKGFGVRRGRHDDLRPHVWPEPDEDEARRGRHPKARRGSPEGPYGPGRAPQLGQHKPKGTMTYERALEGFLEAARAKNRPRTVQDYTRLLTSYGFRAEKLADISPRDITARLARLTPGSRAWPD